jgi:hypothetical protein
LAVEQSKRPFLLSGSWFFWGKRERERERERKRGRAQVMNKKDRVYAEDLLSSNSPLS